jgi:hypothetical protein
LRADQSGLRDARLRSFMWPVKLVSFLILEEAANPQVDDFAEPTLKTSMIMRRNGFNARLDWID